MFKFTGLMLACAAIFIGGCGGSSNSKNSAESAEVSTDSTTSSPVSKTLQLNWTSPDYNQLGELSNSNDISGYQVRYRLSPNGAYNTLTTVANQTSIDISVPSGTYEVSVAAIDNNNTVGEYIGPITLKVEA